MAVLPSASALIVAAGDVKGRVGLWRPHAERHARDEEEADGEEGNEDAEGSSLLVLQAHRRCVGGVLFDSTGALYTGEMILFTVTFCANPANDLTCAPSYIII